MSDTAGTVDLSVCQVGDVCELRNGLTAFFSGSSPRAAGSAPGSHPFAAACSDGVLRTYRQTGQYTSYDDDRISLWDIIRVTRPSDGDRQVTPVVREADIYERNLRADVRLVLHETDALDLSEDEWTLTRAAAQAARANAIELLSRLEARAAPSAAPASELSATEALQLIWDQAVEKTGEYEAFAKFAKDICRRVLAAPASDMNTFEAALRARHNGYNPEARASLPDRFPHEPESPEKALDELIEEATELGRIEGRMEAAAPASEAGPDTPDGCDHEGFSGGCERFGHTPATCPNRSLPPQPAAGPVITGPGLWLESMTNPDTGKQYVATIHTPLSNGRWLGINSDGDAEIWGSDGIAVSRFPEFRITGPYIAPPPPPTLLEAARAFVEDMDSEYSIMSIRLSDLRDAVRREDGKAGG